MIEKRLPDLPIGIQTFEDLRINNFMYIDKTKDLYEIARTKTPCFLSRPRRFGKSILCTTFKALFEGKKHLFDGTWIATSDWQWQTHPVIHIDFNKIAYESPQNLKQQIQIQIFLIAKSYNIALDQNQAPGTLLQLLVEALNLPGKPQPVVLIDEYDKPMINNLAQPAVFEEYRNVLYNCYTPLKSLDHALRFLFITGVSQFSKVSIFSALNHLKNLSSSPKAATICGYTQAELEHNFAAHIAKAMNKFGYTHDEMLAEIQHWYNGYCFIDPREKKERVYNPFSVINFFDELSFKNYWFESGTPTFALNFFKQHEFSVADFECVQASESALGAIVPEKLSLTTVLYQAGYLTIKSYDAELSEYELGFPNYEVSKSCIDGLLTFVFDIKTNPLQRFGLELRNLFTKGTVTTEALTTVLTNICSQTSHQLSPEKERGYQTIFWIIMQMSGLDATIEDPTALGRIDITIKTTAQVYVLEIKIRGKADKAIQQIIDNRYAEKYSAQGLAVTSIGVAIDAKKRALTGCLVLQPGEKLPAQPKKKASAKPAKK